MYTVYAIKSTQHEWIYVGMTNNIERRLMQHNRGYNKSTKSYAPYLLIFQEEAPNRIEARAREKYRKSGIGKKRLKQL